MDIQKFIDQKPDLLLNLYKTCFEEFEDRTLLDIEKIMASNTGLILFSQKNNELLGSIRVTYPQSNYLEIWDLCAIENKKNYNLLHTLVHDAQEQLNDQQIDFFRAITLNIDPYVDIFKNQGYILKRRILRIDWHLNNRLPELKSSKGFEILNGSKFEAETLSNLFIESLKPQWNWWIEDHGGEIELKKGSKKRFQNKVDMKNWLVAVKDTIPIGISGFNIVDKYKAHFSGVTVLPKYRNQGLGGLLLENILHLCQDQRLRQLRVFTVSPIKKFAPGAYLYLKYGGKISAEYFHLEKENKIKKY